MATQKITITLPKAQVERIRLAIASGGSVSSFVKKAVSAALEEDRLFDERLNDILMKTGGPITAKEEAWADALATSGGRRKSSRKRTAA